MNRKIVLFAGLLLTTVGTCTQTFAQAAGQPGEGQALSINSFTAFVKRTEKPVNGSPYADNRWLMAHLTMTSGGQTPALPLRYDVLNKRLVMRSSTTENDSAQLNDNALISFVFDEPAAAGRRAYKRTFRRFMESPEPAKVADYVEVLHEGKFTLLKHYEKTYIKAAPNNGMAETLDRINDKITYYISRPGVAPLPVKLTLKGLQVGLPELASALKAAPGVQNAKTDAEWAAVLNSVDHK